MSPASTAVSGIREHAASFVQKWREFFFTPQPTYTLGLVRIAFGLLALMWSIEVGQDLYDRFGATRFVPKTSSPDYLWSIFQLFPSDDALMLGWIVLMAASVALIVGWHTRIAAILVFVLIMSFERQNPWIFNGGDALIRLEALFIALAPSGAALSLDERRRTGSFFSAQEREIWVLRLIQIQLSVIYLSTVIAKLRGETWQNGTAVSYALRLKDIQLIPVPESLVGSPLFSQTLTWGTLLIEAGIAILVWNRRWRLPVLLAGVVLHLSITLTLAIGFFSFAMFVLYLAFVPPERAEAFAKGVQRRLLSLRGRGEGETAEPAGFDDAPELDEVDQAEFGPEPEPAVSEVDPDEIRSALAAARGSEHRAGEHRTGEHRASRRLRVHLPDSAPRPEPVPDGRDHGAPAHALPEYPTGRHALVGAAGSPRLGDT
ncbi:vitamin K-dependent gamma-carboxylase family protein [Mycolicibacterium hassiacum DSM 44199]|jgi:hypothetical protein|uniref:Vitamin K-dependent gamma-carboxylase family protein n=1 Tax=Mycolicibacterium hassiacum (strain DSM 44199 / CIP 105218 / JCM 12690 / 3849) TaxID=1122247 RepID=K5B9F3_MYCHD|nr:HTTM domain-containing protein [Mycolicibacterium hassiacum]EKF25348.1 vitamin K-dependent gamma-carboxylase family protein [Mycolicibacterium hassiacum DSM 44199]MBX5487251.1 HTTM domain-containing protein [Mycolicibacterium hassiacum]MDA4085603.1 HTTM domain-containing protein [Mycolicibacterium hassiacum DSM 44199]PZN17009.1 MAG: gamma-carboxylase [Mycolicibacterium hassiacum]VCT93000.1 hypothetical protein MHAS_04738 [Mycolicibacterium hassiacum DSM 44199]